MFGGLYFGQALFGWMPNYSIVSTSPTSTFTSYNAEVTTFTTWQDTP